MNVIALGPLTNFAFALMRDPSFADRIGDFRALGGTLHGTGPIDYNKERNFHQDPEAAFLVKKHVKKITLITWEVVHALKLNKELCSQMNELLTQGGKKKSFLK